MIKSGTLDQHKSNNRLITLTVEFCVSSLLTNGLVISNYTHTVDAIFYHSIKQDIEQYILALFET